MRKKLIAILLIVTFLTTICSSITANAATSTSFSVSSNTPVNKIYVKKGEVFNITLNTNPTTGYNWFITKMDSSKIILIGEEHWGFNTNPKIVGAGHKVTYIFKAVNTGTTELQLKYYQSWYPTNVAETYTAIVYISENSGVSKESII